jgi:hypothetical protein
MNQERLNQLRELVCDAPSEKWKLRVIDGENFRFVDTEDSLPIARVPWNVYPDGQSHPLDAHRAATIVEFHNAMPALLSHIADLERGFDDAARLAASSYMTPDKIREAAKLLKRLDRDKARLEALGVKPF